jgi:hypothetical protein
MSGIASCIKHRHLYLMRPEMGTLPDHCHPKTVMRMVRIVDRCGAQNMGSVWVLCRNRTPPTLRDTALGLRLAASSGVVKKGIFILAPMVGNKRNKDENAEQNTNAKETQHTLYGFRGVYVFD